MREDVGIVTICDRGKRRDPQARPIVLPESYLAS